MVVVVVAVVVAMVVVVGGSVRGVVVGGGFVGVGRTVVVVFAGVVRGGEGVGTMN